MSPETRIPETRIPETRICAQLKEALLAGSAAEHSVGEQVTLPPAVLGAFEFYLPHLLRQVYPYWHDESLDGFAQVVAWRTGERSLRVFGLAQLITEAQSWTPCELHFTLAREQARFDALICRLGTPGPDRGGLDRSYTFDRLEEAQRAFAAWRATEAEWVYEVRWPNPERAGSGLGHSRPRAP